MGKSKYNKLSKYQLIQRIDELESENATLSNTISKLSDENYTLKQALKKVSGVA